MTLGPLEAAGFFAVVLALGLIELLRTRALIREGRAEEKRRSKDAA